jgi:hypothetical protein
MDQPSPLATAIATIAAALIAGGIAFLASVLSKEQKTSEFRQAWIDAVREDMSKFIGHVQMILGTVLVYRKRDRGAKKDREVIDFYKRNERALMEFVGIYYRIRLRLNLEKHKELLELVDGLYSTFSTGGQGGIDATKIDSLTKQVDIASHGILKNEWKRVKRGEMSFYMSKYISLSVLVGAGGFFLCYIFGHVALYWVP